MIKRITAQHWTFLEAATLLSFCVRKPASEDGWIWEDEVGCWIAIYRLTPYRGYVVTVIYDSRYKTVRTKGKKYSKAIKVFERLETVFYGEEARKLKNMYLSSKKET